jgi:hypothetical protein
MGLHRALAPVALEAHTSLPRDVMRSSLAHRASSRGLVATIAKQCIISKLTCRDSVLGVCSGYMYMPCTRYTRIPSKPHAGHDGVCGWRASLLIQSNAEDEETSQ